jgi:16S rRNA (uracil1498-N3)-methyltransferase
MSVPYFFEPLVAPGLTHFTLSEQTSKHAIQVLRLQEGNRLDLTNGNGDLLEATVQSADKKNTIVKVLQQKSIAAPAQKIILGISVLKNATRLEWLFEKATEMGVTQIVPIICHRTIHERFKMERMQGILQSAMIQSQQVWLPQLAAPQSFSDFIQNTQATQKLIAHCEEAEKVNIKNIKPSSDLALLIGPEGDFTPDEIQAAILAQYIPIHLGPTRLRTETAGIFALSVLKIF